MTNPQVSKDHYDFNRYVYPERWMSYYHQLREIFALKPGSLLEVGVGDGFMGSYIKAHSTIAYTSVDFDEALSPDVIASITGLPFPDTSFDLTCAFEVLEHLPFEQFEQGLSELLRVSKEHTIVSLPHFGPPIRFVLKIPFLPEIKIFFKVPWPRKHVFNGEHYFEIGKKGFSSARIRAVIKRHATILKEYVPEDAPYHHFFILQKK